MNECDKKYYSRMEPYVQDEPSRLEVLWGHGEPASLAGSPCGAADTNGKMSARCFVNPKRESRNRYEGQRGYLKSTMPSLASGVL